MTNAQTEHSKALRAKTAAEWQRKQRAEGKLKSLNLQVPPELADELSAILKELGQTRAEAVKALCEFYKAHR